MGCGKKLRAKDAGLLPILGAVMAIGALGAFVGALLLVTDALAGFYLENYVDLAIDTPGFDYAMGNGTESGNATFDVYSQMRLMATVALLCLIFVGVAVRVLEARNPESDIRSSRVISRMVARPLGLIILFLVFPMAWDLGTETISDVSTWIINPLYSFDEDRPCPAEWYSEKYLIVDEYNDSRYVDGNIKYGDGGRRFAHLITDNDVRNAEIVCRPDVRTNYLISQAIRGTSYEAYMPDDPFLFIFESISNFATEQFTNTFFLVAKAIVAAQLIITTMMALIMVDVFTGVVIAAMPLLAAIGMIPRFAKISDKFLETLPGLAFIPLLSAVVTVVGSSFVAGVPDQDTEGGVFYSWMAAVGVLFLIGMLPVMVVGLIGSIIQQATGVVRQGIAAGSFVAGVASSTARSAIKMNRQGDEK